MKPFQPLVIDTPLGPVGLGVREGIRSSRRPAAVLIHGLARDASVFMDLIPKLDRVAEVVLVELPGHGRAPFASTPSLGALAERTRQAIESLAGGRPLVIAGESLGALLALSLSPIASQVVAIEPPLRTAQLWPVHWNRSAHPACADLYDNLLGQSAGVVAERDYWPLIDGLSCPTTLLVGSEPLMPPRRLAAAPSLLSPEDRSHAAANPLVILREAPGGHDLLRCAPEHCHAAVLAAVAALTAPA